MPIGAVLGVASAVGGIAQASSAKKAAKAQQSAAEDANATQRYIFDQQVELTEPQRQIGNNALAALAFESGIGPRPSAANALRIDEITDSPIYQREPVYATGGKGEGATIGYQNVLQEGGGTQYGVDGRMFDTRAEAQDYIASVPGQFEYTPVDRPDPNLDLSTAAFQASPGYQFRMGEGAKALERMASARGMRFSGNALKDLTRFSQGTASDEYGRFVGRATDQFNRSYGVAQDELNALRGLAGMGQQATQAQMNAGTNYANAYGANARAGGAAAAQGAIGVGNAITGTINSGANILGMANSGYLGQNPGFGINPVFNPFAGATS